MARMMNSIVFNREYCQYGCCSKVPLWKPKERSKARRMQRAREKASLRKSLDSQD